MAISEHHKLKQLNVSKLPSLPHILVEMLNACGDTHSNFQNIADVTSRDTAIAARVIALANSSFYSRGHKIATLERALLVLGTETLKMIVITASVQQFFSSFGSAKAQYLTQFWERSLACALLAKNLATLTSYANPEEAYLLGLLHNIGELALVSQHNEQFTDLVQEGLAESARLAKERQLFGIDHCEAGAALAHEWSMSSFAVDAIHYHHAPTSTVLDAHHLAKLIHVASALSAENALENPSLESESPLSAAHAMFDLNPALVTEIVRKIDEEVLEVAQSMGISLEASNEQIDRQQLALAKQVRNLSLLQSATQQLNQARSLEELNHAIAYSLQLLFTYQPACIFWIEAEQRELVLSDEWLIQDAPLKIKVADNRSLIASAATKQQILCSLDQNLFIEGLPIVDQQVLGLLKSRGLLCLPVLHQSSVVAVIAAGINTMPELDASHLALLRNFCDEVAKSHDSQQRALSHAPHETHLNGYTEKVQEIAHEANNPLNIIGNYLSTLSDKLGPEHEAQTELKVLREEIDRTGDIILRLRDIEQELSTQEPGVDINQEIQSLATLYSSSLFLTHKIHCELSLDEALTRNPASRNGLRQTLTNLLKNAVEAMTQGGQLAISTSARVNVNGVDYAEIVIRDTGTGIPDNIQKDLFKPVLSTKGPQHSGLGLSITKNLINRMKGTISCRSSKKGTEFRIQLPLDA